MRVHLKITTVQILIIALICIGASLLTTNTLYAHNETLNSYIVQEARAALDKGNVTPLLKWVPESREGDLKTLFDKTVAERQKAKDADEKETIDVDFFGKLVTLYHEMEGTTFAGLSAISTEMNPEIAATRMAIRDNSPDQLFELIANDVAFGLRQRFIVVMERKKHANDNIDAGRAFVKAYIEFIHYVQRLHAAATATNVQPPVKASSAAAAPVTEKK